ncbi:MAG: FeoB-associated Cys-rich membrane protein [Akkermansiaceae bacterium]|nr:FeoB-associated Cys-rich membrane protein [Akkermansiaceae bacterium]
MADLIIILILLGAAALAIRSCLRKSKDGSCPGGCSGCSGNCGCDRKNKK